MNEVENWQRLALSVIDRAFLRGATMMLPLFSGGHDSLSACYIASQHPRFQGKVYHIDTGIGAKATRQFINEVCDDYGWELQVFKSNFSYEKFVRKLGFPGPGAHGWIYNKLKDRCVSTMGKGRGKVALITGCRSQESVRRMGHVEPIKIGETSKKTGKVRRKNRIWTAPCHDWSSEQQRAFMDALCLPRNPVKDSLLGMSGECFCGAFARPNEIALVREFVPDVAAEIDRLSTLAPAGSIWGKRAKGKKKIVKATTGPLCSSCDLRAALQGVLIE